MMKTPDCKDVKCRSPVGVDARIDPRGAEHAGTRLPPWGEAVSGPDR